MKKLITLFFIMAFGAVASNVLIYNPVSSPVPGRSVAFLISVNTTDFEGATNALINPIMPIHPLEWTRVSNNVVVAMSTAESNSIVNLQLTNQLNAAAFSQATARTNAIRIISDNQEQGRLIRALAEVTMDEINILRTNMSPALTPRNLTQLTNAIRGKLQAQPLND